MRNRLIGLEATLSQSGELICNQLTAAFGFRGFKANRREKVSQVQCGALREDYEKCLTGRHPANNPPPAPHRRLLLFSGRAPATGVLQPAGDLQFNRAVQSCPPAPPPRSTQSARHYWQILPPCGQKNLQPLWGMQGGGIRGGHWQK